MVFGVSRKVGLRSSAIPHFGQLPGLSLSTPSHIGQKYLLGDRAGLAPEPGDDSPLTRGVLRRRLALPNEAITAMRRAKKKRSPPRSTEAAASAVATFIPQIGSRHVSSFAFISGGRRCDIPSR